MEKRILFVTESYHNRPSPNGICVQKLAKELVRQGDTVTVLTLKNQEAKERFSEIDGIKVWRVNTYAEWRVLFGKHGINVVSRSISKFFKKIKDIFILLYPFRSPGVLFHLYNIAKVIIRREKIDIVVAVYRDFETAMCGALLARSNKKIKTVLYSLDAISGGVCSNKNVKQEFHEMKCRKWELFFMKHFDMFCPMESHKSVYQDNCYDIYRSKIKYLDIPNLLSDNNNYKLNNDKRINFVFTGMLTESNADCRFFLKIFKEYCRKEDAIFNIYGGISDTIKKMLEEMRLLGDKVIFHGRVSQEELVEIRNQATVFLNFGNEHACGIPCKIFEYMSTGKMIISFSKIEKDASKPYLEKYDNALILKENQEQLCAYVEVIRDFINRNKNSLIPQNEVNQIFHANTPEAFVQIIHSIY